MCRFKVGNGESIRFWEDRWLGDKSLKENFPRLYNLCFDKSKSIKQISDKGLEAVQFRRTLYTDSLELWNHIKECCAQVVLSTQRDTIKWTLSKNGIYTVKSYYRHMIETGLKCPHAFMWKTRMPPRVKVFMWLALRNSILTRDNLHRRGWNGDRQCPFCMQAGSVDHLFLRCSIARLLWNIIQCAFGFSQIPDNLPDLFNIWLASFNKHKKNMVTVGISAICWTIWKLRNGVVFENNKVTDPCVPVNLILKMLHEWLVLQIKPERQKLMREGIRKVEMIAAKVFNAMLGWRNRHRITVG